jgi:hypothetical protein
MRGSVGHRTTGTCSANSIRARITGQCHTKSPMGVFFGYIWVQNENAMANRSRQRACRVDLERMARALVTYDEELKRDAGPRASYAIERWWKERDPAFRPAYSNAWSSLIEAGCDHDALTWRIMFCDDIAIFNSPPFGVPRQLLDEQVEIFRNCRKYYFRDPGFFQFFREDQKRFERLLSLPSTLDLYSELLLHFTKNLGSQSHHYLDISKFLVDGYVNQMTGRYYDNEVALLISSTIHIKRTYSGASHRNWRSNYRKRIESFREHDAKTKLKYKEEKRILEECAVRVHRSMLWDYLLDPDGKHPILRLNASLANILQHGMREGDNIVALNGRPASELPRERVAQLLKDRVWQSGRHRGKPIRVTVYRANHEDWLNKGVTLHLDL